MVHRRARALDPADALVGLLERVLRQWPLSGVLAGLDEGPTSPLDFGGHEGLMLLYAERLARGPSPSWRPSGRAPRVRRARLGRPATRTAAGSAVAGTRP